MGVRARRLVFRLCSRLPEAHGKPIRIGFAGPSEPLPPFGGSMHAGAFLRERRIVLGDELRLRPTEFARIFTHEVFHFAWLRLGNPRRLSYERLLRAESKRHIEGELGWSAEWRKRELARADISLRSRRWREYACESFCDTAAWLFSGIGRYGEFTLPAAERTARRRWFEAAGVSRRISL